MDPGRTVELATMVWPELDRTAEVTTVLVPVGATEQHGPHLPLDADTRIAVAVATAAAHRLDDTVVSPPVAIGASGEHQDFPGTLSIGTEALTMLLVELARSALGPFRRVRFVNCHGGNDEALSRAVALLAREGRDVAHWTITIPGSDAHAGRTETSLLLAIAPETVRLGQARPGDVRPLAEVIDTLRRDGVRAVSDNGVLGDPTGANPDEGRATLDGLVRSLVDAVGSAG